MKRIPPAAVLLAVIILAMLLVPALARRWPEITGAVKTDIAYGPDPAQVLDICVPRTPAVGTIPALVMLHGGAWRSGGRKDWFEGCRQAAASGVVGVAIDYRLADDTAGHSWPAPLVDAQLAMRWVRTHAKEYGIDPGRVCAIGDSAGGHLALFLAALDKPVLGEHAGLLPGVSPKADCAVDWFAPVDFSGFLQHSGMMRTMFVGVAPADYANAERSASPLFAVGPNTSPILIAHGSEDRMVNIKQSETLRDALTRAGVPNQLRIFHGGHEFAGDVDERRAYIDAALAFTKDPLGFLKTK
ncbi:MAG TPA: alpha/beta hydrolase [Alphaproteobacteria bacterium]|jgi:acetyl esterase/lipase|nr:alpha/beta hydrolase [Alphaproteobacteria bacterium]